MVDQSKSDNFKEFINWYRNQEDKKYPKPSVTADALIYTYENNQLKLLLIKRKYHPFKDCYCFPGGFTNENESVEQCVIREIDEETNIKVNPSAIQQVHFFSKKDRDLRAWIMTQAFNVFIYPSPSIQAGDDADDAAWFDIVVKEDMVYLSNEQLNRSYQVDLNKSEEAFYQELADTYQSMLQGHKEDVLAFDHAYMLVQSIKVLKRQGHIFKDVDKTIKKQIDILLERD